jgi:adenosylcobyric acid synthase
MVQGCTSDAGKSTLVAGLCRLLARRGYKVAPFKPQNMALNSAVTADGGEIGRAQALQAEAAGIPLSVHMNPVLLKPNSDTGAQVIIQGHAIGNLEALDYHQYKPKAAQAVFDSFQILNQQYPFILVEGAGSPAEVNLRKGDIANMGFAEEVDCPVILMADIDKGGVFAHIIGTLACLSESERDRIHGFVINRFRGDIELLKDGLDWLEQKTGKPVLGVLPYLHALQLDAEDAIPDAISQADTSPHKEDSILKVIIPLLPHISNHTDFEPLRLHPQVEFHYISHDQEIPPADLIIIPGSKNIAFDLEWLKSQSWQQAIQKHLRYNGKLIGICGGLQILGKSLFDPQQIESELTELKGLGLFDYSTTLLEEKQLKNVSGTLNLNGQTVEIKGYEIHAGKTDYDQQKSAVHIDNQMDGMISTDNQVFSTYLHGLFDSTEALKLILQWAGLEKASQFDINSNRQQQLDRLADTLEEHLDMQAVEKILKSENR